MSRFNKIFLSLLSGILFGFSFPPNNYGYISCISLPPLFYLLDNLSGFQQKLRYLYLTFFTATLITLYWVGGFTHGKDIYLMIAASMLYLWQPFVFVFPFGIFILVKKYLNNTAAYLLFPSIWILIEWFYSYTEFSFPWMIFANTLTYDLNKIQIAEFFGAFGLSYWIALVNVLFYFILFQSKTYKTKIILFFVLIIIYFLPNIYNSNFKLNLNDPIKIAVNQPNIDPWEKWSNNYYDTWLKNKQIIPKFNTSDSIDILILPESAFVLDILENDFIANDLKSNLRNNNISLLTGFVDINFVSKDNSTVTSNYYPSKNLYLNTYNSITFIDLANAEPKKYAKSKLVPFAERIPFADAFSFLIKPLAWSVGISSWEKGTDTTIFNFGKYKFASLVCFESIFPEYVSSFVKKGANFIVFVTNDSWYDDSNGPIQHNQFAILRAIENRRWVVRCANGGISSVISPNGNIISKTKMFDKTTLVENIYPENYLTFYSQYGDWFVYLSNSILAIVVLFLLIKKLFL